MAKKAATTAEVKKQTKAPVTLESAIKALGVKEVRVFKGDDNGLVYARMVKDGTTRQLSADEQQAKSNPEATAKSLVSQARF